EWICWGSRWLVAILADRGISNDCLCPECWSVTINGCRLKTACYDAGIIFLILGFVPKAGALLALTPDAVVGGIFLPAAASLIFTGISLIGKIEKTDTN